jgi:hypothetical protein
VVAQPSSSIDQRVKAAPAVNAANHPTILGKGSKIWDAMI